MQAQGTERSMKTTGTDSCVDSWTSSWCIEVITNLQPQSYNVCWKYKLRPTGGRRVSRILQGRVSNPSERGTAPAPQLFWPMLPEPNNFLALEEIVGTRRSYDI